jgi:hypothetical protein
MIADFSFVEEVNQYASSKGIVLNKDFDAFV